METRQVLAHFSVSFILLGILILGTLIDSAVAIPRGTAVCCDSACLSTCVYTGPIGPASFWEFIRDAYTFNWSSLSSW